ncbi:MAG: hypothetical protein JST42_25400 [Bacteroidetes bacterium]|nr:hypothetical protein [Bacteroidota bacterium]
MQKYFMIICGWALTLTVAAQEPAVHHLSHPAQLAVRQYSAIASVEVLSNLADSGSSIRCAQERIQRVPVPCLSFNMSAIRALLRPASF